MKSSHGTLVDSLQFCQLHVENEKKGENSEVGQVSFLSSGMNEVPSMEKIGEEQIFILGGGKEENIKFHLNTCMYVMLAQ